MKSICCKGEVKLAEDINGKNHWVCLKCGQKCEVDFYGYSIACRKKVEDEWKESEYYKQPFWKPKGINWLYLLIISEAIMLAVICYIFYRNFLTI